MKLKCYRKSELHLTQYRTFLQSRSGNYGLDSMGWYENVSWWTCVPNYCVLKLLCYSLFNQQLIDFVHIWTYILLFHAVLMMLHGPKSTQEPVLQNVSCNMEPEFGNNIKNWCTLINKRDDEIAYNLCFKKA